MEVHKKITRKQRRFLSQLRHKKWYVMFLSCLFFFFPPVKRFISLPVKKFQKVLGIISISTLKVFGIKIGLIDDFIIHKKLRGKGVAQKLFSKAETELTAGGVDYIVLMSSKDRIASHKFYKKIGMAIFWLGVGIVAYKKIRKKK